MKKLNVAVIGTGHLGTWHALNYRGVAGTDLVGVCDTDERTARDVAAQCKTRAYTDHRDLFGKVDAVSIAVPTAAHHPIARDFLSRGVHVLIEKPITRTVEEADELIALARRNGLIIQVGHIERFNSAVLTLAQILKRPRFIECHRLSPFRKRGTDIGVVLDLMIHDLDIMLSLLGTDIAQMQAVGAKVLSGHEDIANVRITFADKSICNLTASRISNRFMRKIRIFQENAYISIDYLKQDIVLYKKAGAKISREKVKVKKVNALQEELRSFAQCVRDRTRPVVAGEDGRAALRLALDISEQIHAFIYG